MTNKYILIWALTSVSLFIGTFIFYVAIMKMREIKKEIYALHWSVRWVCYFILLVGLILNTSLNYIVLTVSFLELPVRIKFNGFKVDKFEFETLSTYRVVRHKYHSTGWRQKQALWWCRNFLTPFDKSHCE